MKSGNLEIKRFLRDKKAVTKTLCSPGRITVLIDESGDGALVPYTNALAGKKTEDRFQFFLDGKKIEQDKLELVGFGDRLPDEASITDYLKDSGFTENEVESIIDEYDLKQSAYLKCSQVSATVTRQLLLLKALKSDAPVLALNDPFLPFNGRWRGFFAEKLIEHAEANKKIILLVNLSFVPKAWEKCETIAFIDVGKAAERARKKAEAKMALESQIAEAAAGIPDEVKSGSEETKTHEKGVLDFVLPEHIVFKYREKTDWLFGPMADFSTTMRTYGGVGMPLAVAFLVVVMAAVMFPNIGYYQDRLKSVATNWDYEEYKKIQEAESKKPKAKFTKEVLDNKPGVIEAGQDAVEVKTVTDKNTSVHVSPSVQNAPAALVHTYEWKAEAKPVEEVFKLCVKETAHTCSVNKKSCFRTFGEWVRHRGSRL